MSSVCILHTVAKRKFFAIFEKYRKDCAIRLRLNGFESSQRAFENSVSDVKLVSRSRNLFAADQLIAAFCAPCKLTIPAQSSHPEARKIPAPGLVNRRWSRYELSNIRCRHPGRLTARDY